MVNQIIDKFLIGFLIVALITSGITAISFLYRLGFTGIFLIITSLSWIGLLILIAIKTIK